MHHVYLSAEIAIDGAAAAEAAAALREALSDCRIDLPLKHLIGAELAALPGDWRIVSADAFDADGAAIGPDLLDAGGGFRFTPDGRIIAPDGSFAGKVNS